MLTLVALKDTNCKGKCKPSGGAVTAIFAGLFYLGVGINILICPTPKTAAIIFDGNCCQNGSVQAVEGRDNKAYEVPDVHAGDGNAENSTVTRTYNADGSLTVTKEVINPNGTKSVTITTSQAAQA